MAQVLTELRVMNMVLVEGLTLRHNPAELRDQLSEHAQFRTN
jgi:hypothetical protein